MPTSKRRPKSLKFHALALGIICVVIIILFFLIGPKAVGVAADPNQPTGDRYVRIIDATWGLNCNPEINRLRGLGKTTVGEGEAQRKLEPVQLNNALYAVTARCEDTLACDILAINETFQLDPLSTCYKELVVGYRCFSVDRKWTRKTEQGTILKIDCHVGVDQSKPTP